MKPSKVLLYLLFFFLLCVNLNADDCVKSVYREPKFYIKYDSCQGSGPNDDMECELIIRFTAGFWWVKYKGSGSGVKSSLVGREYAVTDPEDIYYIIEDFDDSYMGAIEIANEACNENE